MHGVLYGLKWHLLFFACEVKQWGKKKRKEKGGEKRIILKGADSEKVIKKKLG